MIDELQSDRALRQHSMSLGKQSAANQQQKELEILQTNRVNEILRALEGKTIAKTLTYLTEVRIFIMSTILKPHADDL